MSYFLLCVLDHLSGKLGMVIDHPGQEFSVLSLGSAFLGVRETQDAKNTLKVVVAK